GRRPFQSQSIEDLLEMQRSQEPPALRPLVPEIPGVVESAILKALRKDPDQRFPSCEQLAVAIGCQLLRETHPASKVVLEADVTVWSRSNYVDVSVTWSMFLRPLYQWVFELLGLRRKTRLVLTPDCLWAIEARATVVVQQPLKCIDGIVAKQSR